MASEEQALLRRPGSLDAPEPCADAARESSVKDEKGQELRDRIDDAWEDHPVLVRVMAEAHLEAHPRDGYIWTKYGDALRRLGCFAEAKAALERARQLARSDRAKAIVEGFLAEVHCELGEYAAAEEGYRRAAAMEPGEGKWLLFLGGTLRRQQRDPEAEVVFRKALDLEGDREEYLLNLGFVLQARGALEEAAWCFRKALDIDPQYREARESLEDVRRALAFRRAPEPGAPPDDATR
jgi:tetratricopeptide (TPR) repeat protein